MRDLEHMRAAKSAQALRDKAESERKAAMSPEECFAVGYERGVEDAADGYTGAIERTTLGNDYAYPEDYKEGYKTAFYAQTEDC